MKISKTRSKKFIILPLAIIVGILGIGAAAYALTQNSTSKTAEQSRSATVVPNSTPNLDPPSTEESQAGQSTKQDTITKPAGDTSSSTQQSANVSVSASINGSTLRIVANLSDISTDATCSLTLTSGGKTVTKDTVGVQALPSYSTCKGWSLATDELGTGEWTATVTVTSGQSAQTSSTKVTIQ